MFTNMMKNISKHSVNNTWLKNKKTTHLLQTAKKDNDIIHELVSGEAELLLLQAETFHVTIAIKPLCLK